MNRSRLRVNSRRSCRLLACTCAWFALDASLVQGQFIPRSGTSTVNVRNPGLVGNTGVSRNSMYLRTNRARFGGGDPTSGNYVGAGGRTPSVGSGRAWGSRSSLLTGGNAFGSSPATSHFARVFARPQVSGAHLFTTSRAPLPVPLSRRNAHLLHRMVLTNRLGNTAPTRRPGQGRRIRDALSQQSLDNAPPPESYLENLGKRRSYVDMLSERIAAEHARAIKEGWEFLRAGDYRRAILRFEAAETADRPPARPACGILPFVLTLRRLGPACSALAC